MWWDFTVELVWMRRGAQTERTLGLVRLLHLFSGFSAVLQALSQNALQCVADCWFMLKDCFRFASQGKSCYIKMIQDFCPKNFLDKI